MGQLFNELKRRNVLRMAAAYAVVVWLVIQIVVATFPLLGVPDWAAKMVVVLAIFGFPITIVISWIYEWTPEGVMTAEAADAAGYVKSTAFGRQIDFVVIALMALAIGWLVYDRAASPAAPDRSIAVLPFVNMTSDSEQEYFSDGISEELLNVLSEVPELKVAGRTSSFMFKGRNEDLRVIGEALGVAYILEGSVRKRGGQVRVTAQLINAADGFHIWSQTYDRELVDIFAVQDEIAKQVVMALREALGLPAEVLETPKPVRTAQIEAYELYLRGRQYLVQRSLGSLQAARELFKEAIAADPDFADAYASYAVSLMLLTSEFYGDSELDREQSRADAAAALKKALELDPESSEALTALGFTGRNNDAEGYLRRAIVLNPNNAQAHYWLGLFLGDRGRDAEAIEAMTMAVEIEPLTPLYGYGAISGYMWRNRVAEAMATVEKLIRFNPQANSLLARRGEISWQIGDLAEAVGWYQRAAIAGPISGFEFDLWFIYLDLGLYDKVGAELETNRLFAAGDYEGMARAWDEAAAAEISPAYSAESRWYWLAVSGRANAALALGRPAEAIKFLDPLAADDRRRHRLFEYNIHIAPTLGLTLALARRKTGDEEGAAELIRETRSRMDLAQANGINNPVFNYNRARLLVLEGDGDAALSALEVAVEQGWRNWFTRHDPLLVSIRKTGRYRAVVADIESKVAAEREKLVSQDSPL